MFRFSQRKRHMLAKRKLDTIERLRTLKPGEKFIYYRGDLDVDIENSSGQYRLMLEAIRRVSRKWAGEEKIYIFTREVQIVKGKKTVIAYEQVAIGSCGK